MSASVSSRAPRVGVVVFPGSNCDHDTEYALTRLGAEAVELWHADDRIGDVSAVILPGGFSYGDHLRTGAVARFSPVMGAITEFAKAGGLVMGICNGFQILTEAHLLPGALMRNRDLKFICRHVNLRVENASTPFTSRLSPGMMLDVPVAHHDGNYFIDQDGLGRLENNGQVVFRYCAPDGTVGEDSNPNGSVASIAGIVNEAGNVLGMMPHPERAIETALGSSDGTPIMESFVEAAAKGAGALV